MARPQAADYEDRKRLIVDQAARLFAAQSFLGTSITDIAEACNFSKGLMYHYYRSKEELLAAVMASHIDRLVELIEEARASQGSTAERLNGLLQSFMAEYVEAAPKQKVLLYEMGHLPEAERHAIITKQRAIVEFVESLVIEVHPEVDDDPGKARAMTMLLFGMINWTSNWYDPKGPITPAEIADMAAALILKEG